MHTSLSPPIQTAALTPCAPHPCPRSLPPWPLPQPYFPPGYPLPVPHAPFPSAYPPLDPLAAGRRPADGAHVDPYGAQLPPYPYPYNGQLLALLGPGGLAAAADRAALAGGLEDAQVHILRHLLGAGQEGRQGEQAGTGAP